MTPFSPRPPTIAALVTTVLAAGLVLAGPVWLPREAAVAAGLALFAIGLWASSAVPAGLASLAFFALAMLLDAAPASVVFSGFEAKAFWLVFGGLILGIAVHHTGLGTRLARRVGERLHGGYGLIIGGLVGIAVALSFVIPSSMARVMLLVPLTTEVAERFGFAPGTRGRTGMVLAVILGSNQPAFSILTANVPNVVLMGLAEHVHGVAFTYGEYLLLHFPVLGLGRAALLVAAILLLFPDRPRPRSESVRDAVAEAPLSRPERAVGLILAAAVALWATDWLHGVSAAWVALTAGLVCLVPGAGLTPKDTLNGRVNYEILFYLAGVLGLGGLLAHSGAGRIAAEALLPLLPLDPGNPLQSFIVLALGFIAIAPFTTAAGLVAVVTPLAGDIAHASGLPLDTVLMTQVVGFSTMLLPYQVPPLMAGCLLAGEPVGKATRLTLTMAAITVVVLLPLTYLWWSLLGWL
ncbi:hypothetical protein KBTX_04024 [wastewater metagenome]|uniref:Sodium:sulfate symporter transmembrane region n=2 Tax=unclassified sequences TaxID=12908 RepID=A0A5B8RJG3_9ZZZZ|nr:SLC13 family permease [Arhodomonas sp. KWT]QEA07664.1 hypothetical protein KBTEX_04024 [uncultured organism]